MSDPILGTEGNPGAGEIDPVLPDHPGGDLGADDAERIAAESSQTVTNDAVAGETVDPGLGDGNDGPTGGAPEEATPVDLPENDLAGEDIDLDDDSRTLE